MSLEFSGSHTRHPIIRERTRATHSAQWWGARGSGKPKYRSEVKEKALAPAQSTSIPGNEVMLCDGPCHLDTVNGQGSLHEGWPGSGFAESLWRIVTLGLILVRRVPEREWHHSLDSDTQLRRVKKNSPCLMCTRVFTLSVLDYACVTMNCYKFLPGLP